MTKLSTDEENFLLNSPIEWVLAVTPRWSKNVSGGAGGGGVSWRVAVPLFFLVVSLGEPTKQPEIENISLLHSVIYKFSHCKEIHWEFEPAIRWKLVPLQPRTSKKKKTRSRDGSTPEPEPAIGSCDTGQQIPRYDSCQLIRTRTCNISLQAHILARKCDISHWLPCGVNGRADVRSRDFHNSELTQQDGRGKKTANLVWQAWQ